MPATGNDSDLWRNRCSQMRRSRVAQAMVRNLENVRCKIRLFPKKKAGRAVPKIACEKDSPRIPRLDSHHVILQWLHQPASPIPRRDRTLFCPYRAKP